MASGLMLLFEQNRLYEGRSVSLSSVNCAQASEETCLA